MKTTIVPRSKLLDRVSALLQILPLVVTGAVYASVSLWVLAVTIRNGETSIYQWAFPAILCISPVMGMVAFWLIIWALGQLEEPVIHTIERVESERKVPIYVNGERKGDV